MQLAAVRTWRTRVRTWLTQRWVLEAGGLWLGQHIIVVSLVVLFEQILPAAGLPMSIGATLFNGSLPTAPDGFYDHFNRFPLAPFTTWDAWWYSHVASFGYNIPASGAFPPLYPLLEALLAPLCGSPIIAGLVIANVAGLGACLLLRWVLDPLIGPRTSQRTLFYLLCFPTAVFFLAAYTESLYLLLSLAVFAALHRRAFWWAGIFAGLAIMTRYTGAFLVFPLLVALWQARAGWWRYLSAAIAPLLMGGFWVFLIARFHELPTTAVQQLWHSSLAWPWVGVTYSITYLTSGGHSLGMTMDTARDLLLTLILLALAVCVVRSRQPLTFKVYTVTFVLFVLADPILASNKYNALFSVPRYLLPIFPLFIPLAQWSLRSKGLHLALLVTTLLLAEYVLAGFSLRWLLA